MITLNMSSNSRINSLSISLLPNSSLVKQIESCPLYLWFFQYYISAFPCLQYHGSTSIDIDAELLFIIY
jgi:hypothetical protein